MISDAEVRVAEWIIKQACQERTRCYECPHYDNCGMSSDDEKGYPSVWDVPAPPSEPAERPRIEWLRCLPDDEILLSIEPVFKCADCQWKGEDCCNNDDMTCNNGHMDWWHEVVTLDRFRKDVGLP